MSELKAYAIYCATGCSCCSNENHMRGPFKTLKTAEDEALSYYDRKMLASQYAANGLYSIYEITGIEHLDDGRLIIGNRILDGFAEDTYNDEMPGDTWDYDCNFITTIGEINVR